MIGSKATAALMRLKEMDRKYNIKCNESKRGQCNVSTESSIEDTPKTHLRFDSKISDDEKCGIVETFVAADAGDKARSKSSPNCKSKIEVRMPSLVGKGDDVPNSTAGSGPKNSSEDFCTISIKTSLADEDTDVQLKERYISTGKKSPRPVSNLNSTSREYNFHAEDKVQVQTPESVNLAKNEQSSIATILSETSDGSEIQSVIVSEAIESVDVDSMTRRSRRKPNTSQEPMVQNSIKKSNIGDDGVTIDQVLGTSDERSEIISELSKAMNEVGDLSKESSKEYESDTFEEDFSSTASLSSMENRSMKASTEKPVRITIRSGVKQIMITSHKRTESVQKTVTDDSLGDGSSKVKEIIELVPPKIMQNTSECDIELDEELSNYVKTTEYVDQVTPITLLKTSKQTTSTHPRKQPRRIKRHRKSSNENTDESREKSESPVVSVRESLTKHKENKNEDNVLRENNLSEIGKIAEQKNEKELETLVKASDIKTIDMERGASENDVRNVESNTISSKVLLRETPKTSDVTCTLRELNRDAIDAIIRRRRTIRAPRNAHDKSRNCQKCGTIVRLPLAAYQTVENDEADDNATGSLENLKESSKEQRSNKRNKVKRGSKSSKVRKPSASSRGKVEEKHSRFDCRQSHRLRKQAAALRLQQEREDIRNYLLELERTRLEFGPGDAIASSKLASFKPLEFPKIAAFVKPELADVSLKSQFEVSELQERITTIKRWLRDQYVLYRDYSSLAQTANAKYIPASLEDAKRVLVLIVIIVFKLTEVFSFFIFVN
ncbi:uncharacterized protein LOC128879192 isoform X1 [Hylaeus volcanicus]|uniref:uncharacterized protein LOC128879192 isoform X1 n=1 Tax=Hylaeus volcanicus TaxID=313075 RepID=UPI0023B7E036|nr:uncharacterized protein LOC128879192 isoform X1 [Hylaeus volcanicus]